MLQWRFMRTSQGLHLKASWILQLMIKGSRCRSGFAWELHCSCRGTAGYVDRGVLDLGLEVEARRTRGWGMLCLDVSGCRFDLKARHVFEEWVLK